MSDKQSAGFEWIEKNRETLPEDEWIAANEFGLVGHNSDLRVLFEMVKERRKQGISPTIVCFAYIPFRNMVRQ